jgi:hypothetical protein
MDIDINKGKGAKRVVRWLCFMAFGAGSLANPMDPLNLFSLGLGAICGLIFGGLFRMFLIIFLSAINSKLKKEKGKGIIKYAVDSGMLFLTPFAIMLLIAVYYLGWAMILPFVSAGIMAVGTASSIELGKISERSTIKNTAAVTIVSFGFSTIWIMSLTYLIRAPFYLEGGINLIRSMMGGGTL